MKLTVRINGNSYYKSGVEYLRVDDVKVDVRPSSVRVRFDNLFNGNKQLEEVGNDVINQNVDLITKDVIPQVEQGIERKVLQIVNQVFTKGTAAEFFP